MPDRFGKKNGPSWRTWSYLVRDFVGVVHVALKQAMKAAENQKQPIAVTHLQHFVLRTGEPEDRPSTDFSRRGAPFKGQSTKLSEPGPPVETIKRKRIGSIWRAEHFESWVGGTREGAPEVAPNVSARGADEC